MITSETIPMAPQPWCRNPAGYVKHQHLLKQLTQWFETQGATVELPEDTGTWDKGIDLIVNGLRVDLKSFGLGAYGNSYTWNSTYHQGRPAPLYEGTETDWFVHPAGDHPSEWIAGPVHKLRTSKYGYAPYYFKSDTIRVADLL